MAELPAPHMHQSNGTERIADGDLAQPLQSSDGVVAAQTAVQVATQAAAGAGISAAAGPVEFHAKNLALSGFERSSW